MFSMSSVYIEAFSRDVAEHYAQSRFWIKKKCSKSKVFPAGSQTRLELYKGAQSCITPLCPQEIADLQIIACQYYCNDEPSPWQLDPLKADPAAIAARGSLISHYRQTSNITLAEEYIIHHFFTKCFLESKDIDVSSDSAVEAVLRFMTDLAALEC